MEAADPLTSALWTSLGALVPVLPPPRVVPALQRALRDLLAERPEWPPRPWTEIMSDDFDDLVTLVKYLCRREQEECDERPGGRLS